MTDVRLQTSWVVLIISVLSRTRHYHQWYLKHIKMLLHNCSSCSLYLSIQIKCFLFGDSCWHEGSEHCRCIAGYAFFFCNVRYLHISHGSQKTAYYSFFSNSVELIIKSKWMIMYICTKSQIMGIWFWHSHDYFVKFVIILDCLKFRPINKLVELDFVGFYRDMIRNIKN